MSHIIYICSSKRSGSLLLNNLALLLTLGIPYGRMESKPSKVGIEMKPSEVEREWQQKLRCWYLYQVNIFLSRVFNNPLIQLHIIKLKLKCLIMVLLYFKKLVSGHLLILNALQNFKFFYLWNKNNMMQL